MRSVTLLLTLLLLTGMSPSCIGLQARYTAGTKDILTRFFEGRKLNPTDVILEGGKMAAQYDQVGHRTATLLLFLPCSARRFVYILDK